MRLGAETEVPRASVSAPAARMKRSRTYLWYLGPALVVYVLLFLAPSLALFPLSLFDYNGLGPLGRFLGIAQYTEAMSDGQVHRALVHNAEVLVALLAVQTFVSLPLASFLNRKIRGRTVYLALIFLPFMVSPVATGFMWQLLFNPTIGLVNPMLGYIGLSGIQHAWLADTRFALPTVILAMAWQWNGLAVVLFLAGLQKVPPDLHDAAEVDGAKRLRIFRDVTFPHLTPAYGIATALLAIYAFRAFDLPYVISGAVGAPDQATLLLGVNIYGAAYGTGALSAGYNRMGYALAQGVILLVVMAIVASLILAFFGRRQRRVFSS